MAGTPIYNWDRKWADLKTWAERTSGARLSNFNTVLFYDSDATSPKSIEAGLRNWSDGRQVTSNSFRLWLPSVITSIGFDGDSEEFIELRYDEWLTRCSKKFVSSVSEENEEHQKRAHIYFNAECHTDPPAKAWDDSGAVDQRYMYTDRKSAAQWAEMRSRKQYGLYDICKNLSRKSADFIAKRNSDISQIIFLGAGSPDKDWDIILPLMKGRTVPLSIYFCDASFYMIIETVEEIEKLIAANSDIVDPDLIKFELCCFDFSRPSAWRNSCGYDRTEKALFVILGCTIENVAEWGFFDTVRAELKAGDNLLIGASFYADGNELAERGETDIVQQYGSESRLLALNSISNLLDEADGTLTHQEKIDLVKVTFESASALNFGPKIASAIPGTMAATFSIRVKDLRNPPQSMSAFSRIILVTSRRYLLPEFLKVVREHLKFDLVLEERSKKSDFPYYHLLLEKS